MTRVIALLAALFLASCAGRKPLPVLPIPKAIPVAPAVQAVRPGLDRAGDTAAALAESNNALATDAAAAKRKAAEAATEARRLAKQGSATAAELERQASLNDILQSQAAELDAKIAKQEAAIASLRQALNEARAALSDALAAAAQGDSAANLLTQQVQSITAQYQKAEATRQSLSESLAVKDDTIAKRTRLLIGLSLVVALYVAARIFKATSPTARAFLFWLL